MSKSSASAGYSSTGNAPGPIDPTTTDRFFSRDGTPLYGEWFETEAAPRALALMVHGYAEHCGRYHEVAHVLTEAGIAVQAYDMRGHGRAAGQRGHVDRYLDYVADMEAALDELIEHARRYPDADELPIILLTHSNGGLVALRALSDPFRAPKRVSAAIFSSPFLGLKIAVPLFKRVIGKAAGRIAPTLSLPSEIEIDHLTHDPEKLAERHGDDLCHEVASAGWFISALETQQYVAEYAHRVAVPSLWLLAGNDLLADAGASRQLHQRLIAPTHLVELEGMYHELFNEVERGVVFDHVRAFIEKRLASQPGTLAEQQARRRPE